MIGKQSFVQLYVSNQVRLEAVASWVSRWYLDEYSAKSPRNQIPLHDYLGLTHEECQHWQAEGQDLEILKAILLTYTSLPEPIEPEPLTKRSVTGFSSPPLVEDDSYDEPIGDMPALVPFDFSDEDCPY